MNINFEKFVELLENISDRAHYLMKLQTIDSKDSANDIPCPSFPVASPVDNFAEITPPPPHLAPGPKLCPPANK